SLGCATREEHARRIGHVEETRDTLAGLVIPIRSPHRERVRAPVRVGVVVLIEITDRVEHDVGLLRRRRGIEVVQTGARRQQGKVRAPRLHLRLGLTRTFPSSARTSYTGSGSTAGPRHTAPVRHEYCVPCQTHSIVPSLFNVPSDIGNSACVQALCTAPIVPRKLNRQISSPSTVVTARSSPSGTSSIFATISNSVTSVRPPSSGQVASRLHHDAASSSGSSSLDTWAT